MRYVAREHIDIQKWDACINASENGLVYGRSIFLDHMAKRWDALVHEDYKAVMPLTWNRKYGIKYLYQPPFTQQLGIFGTTAIDGQLIESFLAALGERFRFAEIFLNHNNHHPLFIQRPNYILSLKSDYAEISQSYKNVLEKNLRRASNAKLQYRAIDDIEFAVKLYGTKYGKRFPQVREGDYHQFAKLCAKMNAEGTLVLRGAFRENSNSLLSCILLLRFKNRMHLLQSVTVDEGRTVQANHFLIDNLVREFAGRDFMLDFEGSSVPGIAEFYKTFGATDEPYYFFRYNRLPWPFRLFK